MERADIQKALDGLDIRLAMGEIDMGTYQSLKAKFAAMLTAPGAGSPLASAVGAIGREAKSLKCPNCMAPLPAPEPAQTNVTCEYCGSTSTLQTAQGEMEKLRGDVRKWIREVAGAAAGGEGVDAAARQFIFRDKLLPQLRLATERATELYHPTRYLPLFSFPLPDRLGSTPFLDARMLTPDPASLAERLKGVVAQVQAPELVPFAVGDREKSELQALEVSSMEVAYLSNVRHRLGTYAPDGFSQARANLRALSELYSSAAKMSKNVDASYAAFSEALAGRVGSVDRAAGVLSTLLAPSEGVMTDKAISDLDAAAAACEKAAADIEAAGREPKESAPAAEGSRNDAQVIRMLADTTRIYAQCAAEAGEPFGNFLNAVGSAVDRARAPGADTLWLNGFLANLARHTGTIGGDVSVPVVADYGWVEAAAMAGAKSSLFGGKETFEVQERLLVPFWVSEIHFSEQSGAWFWKKGQAAQGLLLMDATRHGGTCYIEPGDSPLTAQCYSAVESPRAIGGSVPAVAPTVSAEVAHRCMKNAIAASQQYRGGFVKPPTIIYLPAAVVRFASKKQERREVYLPGAEPRATSLGLTKIRLGTRDLLLAG